MYCVCCHNNQPPLTFDIGTQFFFCEKCWKSCLIKFQGQTQTWPNWLRCIAETCEEEFYSPKKH